MWRAFWQIEKRGRTGNGFSALPISNREVESWCRLRGERLMPWELDVLDRMEDERLSLLNSDTPEVRTDQKLTPDLFRSLFNQ